MRNLTWNIPVFVAKLVKTSGHVSDLKPLEIGIFDRKTSSVATASGNGIEFFIGSGSAHTKDKLSKFYGGMTDPKKSSFFKGKDLISFEKAFPQKPENEEWVVGYNGDPNSKGLTFEKNKQYILKVRLFGEGVVKKYQREVERTIHLNTFACTDGSYCAGDCPDKTVDYKKTTIEWVKKINEDVELREFKLKTYPVFDDYNATATTAAFTGGTGTAATVSVQTSQGVITGITVLTPGAYSVAPTGLSITNAGGGSGATFTIQTTGSSPNITVTGVTVTNGGSGYTYATPNSFVYDLTVPDNGDADALFAIQRAYPSLKIERVSYALGRSTYRVIGLPSAPANYTPTSSVLLAACGTCPAGYTLTAGFDTWIVTRQLNTTTDLDNDAARTAFAATIVSAYSATSGSGVFLGVSEGSAKVKINVTSGTAVVPATDTSDSVEKIASTPATCVPSAPSAVSWVQTASGYTVTRNLRLTVNALNCSDGVNETVTDVVASLASVSSYVSGSASDVTANNQACSKTFQISQRSKFMTDRCESPDVAEYDELPTFRGVQWVGVVDTSVNTTVKCGIRFTAPFISIQFGDESFAPDEYYDNEPVKMEVSVYDQSGNPCSFTENGKGIRVKQPKYRRLSGEFVARDVIRNGAYFTYEQWSQDPRMREVMDNTVLSIIDRNKYYVAYYLKFKESRGDANFNQFGQIWEPIIYVEEGLTSVQTALENALLAITAKFNVELQKRG